MGLVGKGLPESLEQVGKLSIAWLSRAHLWGSPAEGLSRRMVSTKGLLERYFFAHVS